MKYTKHDLHIHTNFSDGHHSPQKIIKLSNCLNNGIKVIGFTDHVRSRHFGTKVNSYIQEIEELQQSIDLQILLGGEITLLYFEVARIEEKFANKSEFPFLSKVQYLLFENIFSIGDIPDICHIQQLFSIPIGLAHFSYQLLKEYPRTSIEKVAEVIASSGLFLELNTHRLNYMLEKQFYECCIDLGTPLSLGSDAHSSSYVGEVDHALEYLRKLGKLNLLIDPSQFG